MVILGSILHLGLDNKLFFLGSPNMNGLPTAPPASYWVHYFAQVAALFNEMEQYRVRMILLGPDASDSPCIDKAEELLMFPRFYLGQMKAMKQARTAKDMY